MCRTRVGSTLLEAVAGLAIMVVACTLIAQLTAFATRQMRVNALHQLAVQEAANLLDQYVTCSDVAGSDVASGARPLSAEAARQLPNGTLNVTLTDEATPPAARQIAVEVTWDSPFGNRPERVRLVSWRYDTSEEPTP